MFERTDNDIASITKKPPFCCVKNTSCLKIFFKNHIFRQPNLVKSHFLPVDRSDGFQSFNIHFDCTPDTC